MKLQQTLNSSLLDNLEPMLNESIYHFLVEFQKGRTDFSELGSIFFRLIQTMIDPPLEFIWFYSALTFHTAKSTTLMNSQSLLLSVKDLFHSLVSFRNPSGSGSLKQVSLLAPVVYQLVSFRFEISRFRSEFEGLVDAIVSHIVVCCNNELEDREVAVGKPTVVSWVGLVPVWIADQVTENRGCVDGLQLFLPLSTEEVRRGIGGDCGMGYLAGIVMMESFLLRLCLMFDPGASRKELDKDVKLQAAQIIKGFKKNSTFLVMLFKVLLEPRLPVAELLTTSDELLLRRLLFDVALDFGCFLSCETSSWLSDDQYKEIAILWLFVTNSALQFVSENGDTAEVDFYLNAFLTSQLPAQIISWVTGGTHTIPTTPLNSSPKELIGWLLVVEKQGIKICDHSISELHEKAVKHNLVGIENIVETMVEDAHAPVRINGRRKRDSMGEVQLQKQMKAIKYCHENLGGDDSYCGRNEVGNSVSDQEMVDMVR
ncbi:hypothetical protein OSB04_022017 [Centaurea solstitialis]|uniref:Uncharacterized protein n=1 Tax=Centaurea solstitialis TaxID=347529 RepID=A0AA38SWY0_9ASTR|nr:hypothetical protein OSB04_022017 [Centaurea solstitialis]